MDIYETNLGGFVTQVDVFVAYAQPIVVFTGPDTTACPGILSIPFSTDLPVVGVTVHTAKVGWEEIDAVAVINSAPPATAQTLTCTVEHITGDQCQGPDIEGQASAAFWEALGFQEPPGDNFCSVGVWVQKATCEVSVPGGVTTNAGIGWTNNSDGNDPVTYHVVLRDAQSGTVLYDSGEQTSGGPFMGVGPWNTNGGNGAGTVLENVATDKVICEITGTHSVFGATYELARNTFSCAVNN